jgi:hypothetical protein
LTSPSGVHSYCFLLTIGFDDIFGDLLFLKCLFSLYVSVFMLTLIFHLRNFPLGQFGVRNVGYNIPPVPDLSVEAQEWMDKLLREQGRRGES